MKRIKAVAGALLCTLAAGCVNLDTPGKKAPFTIHETVALNTSDSDTIAPQQATVIYSVEAINVTVPDTLSVSEANSYLPGGDIVWRGDPRGNRYEQVAAIFEDSFERGTAEIQGFVPVVLDVEVLRFHALTEKTRYTVGGVHSIRFQLAIRSAESGMLLEEPRTVQADLDGYGGTKAIEAEAQGQTQKVRISDHLARVIETELTTAEGFQNPRLGFVQMLNNHI